MRKVTPQKLRRKKLVSAHKLILAVVDDSRVKILCDFGYPKDHVVTTVMDNEANYCLAGYYLLGIDQNY